jgi:photosynthetic reaction center cytochrome c subunit
MRRYAFQALAVGAILAVAFAFTLERPSLRIVQWGYRGTGEVQVFNGKKVDSPAAVALNALPEPDDKVDPSGTPSSQAYQNVQVLKDVDSNEFLRLMNAITKWVAPEQGCAYCHGEGGNFAEDNVYAKVVARRMIQMTQHLNADWKTHVANTGVTCYTCHRGNPVPKNVWYKSVPPKYTTAMLGNKAGQNAPAPSVGLASLPNDPFTPFLEGDDNIRVISTTALPAGNRSSIKQAEWTYGLMMHMSTSLGVNCTFCHNTRSFFNWQSSTPQRATAWYGIRMVRDINKGYIDGLTPVYAAMPERFGPAGDLPKANCATCHQGAYKPLYGKSMIGDYPELAKSTAGDKSAAITPKNQHADKQQVENAFFFRIDGKDKQGRAATFDFVVLTDEYTWAIGSTRDVVSHGKPLSETEVTDQVFSPGIRASLANASDIIAVGLASSEGERTQEEQRALARSQTVKGWVEKVASADKGIWALVLGQYNKGCKKQEDASTSFERPLIFVGVRSKADGTDLQEALANALEGRDNLPSRECYSRFDMIKAR